MKIDVNMRRVAKKPWVLAPTISKIVGAEGVFCPVRAGKGWGGG